MAWDSDIDKTRLETCWTVGAKDSNQITAVVYHQPTGEPHAVARILTEHWKSLGFTVKTVIDWTKGDYIEVEIAADRADGTNYNLSVSTHNMSIQAWSECSTDPLFPSLDRRG